MGSNENSVQLKVFVDKKKEKVMFAEAEEDFVEILFSFFTLPLGTIARLSRVQANLQNIKVGSLTSLYESVVNLNEQHFSNKHCKDALLYPNNASVSILRKLKINLQDTNPVSSTTTAGGSRDDAVFVKKKTSFIITDDLNVVPVLLDASIGLLSSLGVEYIDLLDERTICFGVDEFSKLLKWSLLTNNPLTNLVLLGSKLCPCSCSCCSYSSCITNSTLSNPPSISMNSSRSRTMKLLVQKSKKKVLCAQVENFFVELLFSFLTIPLGTVKRLTKDNDSSPTGIDNLYNSISSLGNGKYLKSDDIKTMLLSPKLAPNYLRVTDFLPVYDVNTSPGQFLKERATFVVSDDLEVTVSPSISTILKFNTLGIPVGDIEVMEVNIGEQEALLILKASITSTSALTDCLDAFMKKPKATSFDMKP